MMNSVSLNTAATILKQGPPSNPAPLPAVTFLPLRRRWHDEAPTHVVDIVNPCLDNRRPCDISRFKLRHAIAVAVARSHMGVKGDIKDRGWVCTHLATLGARTVSSQGKEVKAVQGDRMTALSLQTFSGLRFFSTPSLDPSRYPHCRLPDPVAALGEIQFLHLHHREIKRIS